MALLSKNELMTGVLIEKFLSHLVSSNTNMSFTGTYFVPGLLHRGQLYWNYLTGTKHSISAQTARDVKDVVKD
jgi:hypothetical protein